MLGSTGAPIRRALGAVLALLLTTGAFSASPLQGQNVVVDRGTFVLSRAGSSIGTEEFTLRRSGRGGDQTLIGTGEVSLELDGRQRRINSALEATGPELRISAYQMKQSGDRESAIYMTRGNRRFQAKVVTPEGEQVREYRASPEGVVLEEWMFHHYYFVVARVGRTPATVSALVPTTGEQRTLRVTGGEADEIRIAGESVGARRLRVEGPTTRDLWVDDRGRLLLVVDRDTDLRAERRSRPD